MCVVVNSIISRPGHGPASSARGATIGQRSPFPVRAHQPCQD